MTEPFDWDTRLRDALAAAAEHRQRDNRRRASLAAARAAGLAHRHVAKLAKEAEPTDRSRTPVTPSPDNIGRRKPHPDFAETIAGARARAGLTQAELARLIGVSAGHVHQLEHGRCRPSRVVAWQLIVALELSGRAASVVAASAPAPDEA